ncbi:putative phosphatase regulatory subunit-domain-containing protein [Panaeolus papilionaceus]|nr:putative phosphatase regulatory subunit-domain-containing protein [Panaeolus papilionaceus]
MSLRLSVDALRSRNVSESNVSVGGSTSASGSKSTSALCETFGEAKLIRKKSGQLVKPSLKTSRSASRNGLSVITLPLASKSEPTTPTSKAVHFDAKLEHVKLFLAEQKPLAVSRDGSPTDDTSGTDSDFPAFIYGEGEDKQPKRKLIMQVANMPGRVCPDSDVALEELSLSSDGSNIVGRVRVRNIAYAKWVAVRFTLDSWQTVSEVTGKYIESLGPSFDCFGFTIRLNDLLARIEGKTLVLAIRYSVADREIWDNNNGQNYYATFTKAKVPQERRSVSVSDDEASTDMVNLRTKLEKVASVSDSRTGPAFSSQHVRRQSLTSSPDTAFRTSPSLAARYDFANSLKAPWKPSSSPPVHARTNSFPLSSSKASSPSLSAKAPVDPYISKHTKSKPALGSPRDVDREILAPAHRKASFEAEDAASFKAHRHHQRGYFDISVPPVELKKTPSSGPPLLASLDGYISPPAPILFPVVDGSPSSVAYKRDPVDTEDESALSTPSMVTPSSSRSSTPSPTMFTSMGVSADDGLEVQSPETHYRQFLNKFCFFTGPDSDPIQRAHSASEVEELLTSASPRLASITHAASTIRSPSLESVVSRSGSITPTISRIHLEPAPVRS